MLSADLALLCKIADQAVKSTNKIPKAALVGKAATQAVKSIDKTLKVVPAGEIQWPMENSTRPQGNKPKWHGSGSKHRGATKANTDDTEISRCLVDLGLVEDFEGFWRNLAIDVRSSTLTMGMNLAIVFANHIPQAQQPRHIDYIPDGHSLSRHIPMYYHNQPTTTPDDVEERHMKVCRIDRTELYDDVDEDDFSYDEVGVEGHGPLVDSNTKGCSMPCGPSKSRSSPVSLYRIRWDEEFSGGGLGSGQCRFRDG
ncbi:hypothetical protein GLAREA_01116 [Glarea lozoyensis ATCC 20868]|uniref:Uncharacterized protein n=1 Tax=Glarea lozoyensis (strain ATCC 20868 / MF5171) TaxID=1116229 RepID=S3DD83_GLAL2|nr:uncharacterized protein GLAREA_01116 [Glarea lozoyensis ATCC 20868]EPE29956.1 hypothetical protein GLAREA_01116 [Glarea lozoyensis ATCC 20868]